MNKLSNELISAGAGALGAILFFFILDFGILWGVVLTLASFGGTYFMLTGMKPKELIQEDDTRTALATGNAKLNTIMRLSRNIQKPLVNAKALDVCRTIDKILKAIQDDPTKLKAADQFLTYYLDTTIKILSLYLELSGKNIRDIEIANSLARVENTLGTLKDAFEKQLAKLLSSDAMNLDAELHLLEQTINMEGLGKSS